MSNQIELLKKLAKLIESGKSVFQLLWSFDAKGPVLSLFCADINNDGKVEVIVPSQNGYVYALNNGGDVLWMYRAKDWARSVFVADINQDNNKEIIVGSEDSSVHILRNNGELIRICPVNNWARSVGCADINDDMLLEIIVGCEDGHVYAMDQNGAIIWDYNSGARVYSVFVFRNEIENKNQIAVGTQTRKISVLETSGEGKDIFSALAPIRCLFVADVDKDSNIEIIAGSEDCYIYVLGLGGELKWKYKTRDIVRTVTIEDIDQDGEMEIIAGGMDNYVYIISSEGKLKWKYKANYRVRTVFTADIFDGQRKELLIGSEDGPIFVYKTSFSPNLLENIRNAYLSLQASVVAKSLDPKAMQLLIDLDILKDDPKDGFVTLIKAHELSDDFQNKNIVINDLIHLREEPFCFLWEYSAEQRITSIQSLSTEVGPSVFISSEDYTISALSIKGNKTWNIKARNQIICMEVSSLKDKPIIVAGTADNKIYTITIAGDILEEFPQNDRVWSLHLLHDSESGAPKLLIGSYDRQVHFVDLLSRATEWSFHTGHWVKSVWSYDINQDGKEEIIAGSYDKKIYVLSQKGELIWDCELPDWPNAVFAAELTKGQGVEIFVAAENARIYALNAQGFIKWSYAAEARMQDIIAYDIDDDDELEVIAGSTDGFLYVLDCRGNLKWRYNLGREIRCMDLVNIGRENYLWIGFNTGEVFAFQIMNSLDLNQKIQGLLYKNIPAILDNTSGNIGNGSVFSKTPFLQIELVRRIIATQGLGPCINIIMEIISSGDEEAKHFLAKELGKYYISDRFRDDSMYLDLINNLFVVSETYVKIGLLSTIKVLIKDNKEEFAWRILKLLMEDTNEWVTRETLAYISTYTLINYPEAISFSTNLLRHKNEWIRSEAARSLGILVSRNLAITFSAGDELLEKSNNDLVIFKLFMIATTGISREIISSYYQILIQNHPNEQVAGALRDLANLAGLASDSQQIDKQELKDSFSLLNNWFGYSKIEDLANLANDVINFKSKYREATLSLARWLKDFDFSKEISKCYGDYFEESEKGAVIEQTRALDSLLGVLSRADKNISRCSSSIIKKIFTLIVAKWHLIIDNQQNELVNSARIDKVTISLPSFIVGMSVGCTIQLTNIGLRNAETVSLEVRNKEGVYRVVDQQTDSVTIPPDTSFDFNCLLMPLVPRIPRLSVTIKYQDAKGLHIIDEFYEVQVEEQIKWVKPLPEHIYDEKGAITDQEEETPFVGREELIKSLSNWDTKPTIVYGQKRSGKTSTLYRCLNPALHNNLIPYFISFQDLRSQTIGQFLHNFLFEHRSLGNELSSRGRGLFGKVNSVEPLPVDILSKYKSDSGQISISLFFEALREINYNLKNHRLIIYADELEDFIDLLESEKVLPDVLSPLRATFEHYKNITFVFTASVNWTRNIGQNPVLHNAFNFVERKKVGFLTNEEAASLINDPFRGQVIYSSRAIKRAIRATGGNPYLLQKLCGKAIRLLNIKRSASIDIEIINEAVSSIASDLDPCLTNYWGLLKENSKEYSLFKTMLPKPEQWKMLDLDWIKIEDIASKVNENINEITGDIYSLIDKEYLESRTSGGQEIYRVKIGMLPDWLSSNHLLLFNSY